MAETKEAPKVEGKADTKDAKPDQSLPEGPSNDELIDDMREAQAEFIKQIDDIFKAASEQLVKLLKITEDPKEAEDEEKDLRLARDDEKRGFGALNESRNWFVRF